jgi:signal transduction histidine kinase
VLTQKQELDRAHRRLSRANERLRLANEQLTELDRENTDLLALAAHGLRGPLLNLQGFSAEMTQVLRELQSFSQSAEGLTAEEQRTLQQALFEDSPEALDFIRASTERMDQLIQAILRLAQLGRQRLEPQFIVTDELVNEVVRSLSYQIVQSRAILEIGSLPSVVADRHALRLVFENLLNNAILYLDPKRPGRIQVRGESRQETVIFQVEDSGRGIPKDQEDVVFKLFGRATNSEMPGEGMGLAYVRAVLERQGGRIWFQSTADQGTTFTFSLPQTPAGSAKAAPR